MSNEQHPLNKLYGLNALELALEEIKELEKNSNIPFDKELMQLGISFLLMKATEIIENKKPEKSLRLLVSESFGEASICKYNVMV